MARPSVLPELGPLRHQRNFSPKRTSRQTLAYQTKTEPEGSVSHLHYAVQSNRNHAENEDPQPQVLVAFGFLITNCAPFRSSL
ncbi:hypothetical protein ABH944_000183 [Caballeronia udeis]|uniref:Uncharacterized protein n=1 Tax=Caballeronia udeis TaxID=1232866 RepID=A0ABW8M948_9BURK